MGPCQSHLNLPMLPPAACSGLAQVKYNFRLRSTVLTVLTVTTDRAEDSSVMSVVGPEDAGGAARYHYYYYR